MNDKICKVIDIIFNLLPIDKKQILCYSCLNQYNDNPKYLAEKLHQLEPSLKLVWATGELENGFAIPNYFKQVKYGSIKYLYEKNRSAVVIDNGYGIASGYATGIKRKLNMLRKKKGQVNVSTWHGTPFKQVGADDCQLASKYKNEDFFSLSDVLVLGSEYEKSIMAKITNNTVPIELFGNPRNDLLYCKSQEEKRKIKEKLGLPIDKKIVLFAPTYREDNVEYAGIYQMKALDIQKLCECLKEKFGGEWAFALRFHQNALRQLKNQEGFKFGDTILDGHKSADMSEYLFTCDALITDFSSTLYDVLHTHKPCFLYAPDYDEYLKARGIYMQPEEFPFSIAKSEEILYNDIIDFDTETYQDKVEKFLKRIGNVNDGKASQRAAQYIQNYLNS